MLFRTLTTRWCWTNELVTGEADLLLYEIYEQRFVLQELWFRQCTHRCHDSCAARLYDDEFLSLESVQMRLVDSLPTDNQTRNWVVNGFDNRASRAVGRADNLGDHCFCAPARRCFGAGSDVWFGHTVTLESYETANRLAPFFPQIEDGQISRSYYQNTIQYVVMTLVVQCVTVTLAAFAFVNYEFPGQKTPLLSDLIATDDSNRHLACPQLRDYSRTGSV